LSAGTGFYGPDHRRINLSAAIFFRYDFFSKRPLRGKFLIAKTMQLTLTSIEARVLGALIEKEITTPEYYPLSLNALTNACNQKSNRDPVMHLEESEIRKALNHLEYQSLVRSVSSTDSRVSKFEHRLQEAFNFYRPEVAIVCELLLRGPQTPGELRVRASRMHAFEDLESVHSALNRLEKREPPLVTMLPRRPGTKEVRYAHLLSDTPPATLAAPAHVPAAREGDAGVASPSYTQRIESLVAEMAELRKQIADLQSQFAAFRKQFE
jgi:uncharacterized protein YceH (UPF0502 family)